MNRAKLAKPKYIKLPKQILFAESNGKQAFIIGSAGGGDRLISVSGSAPLPVDAWLKMTNGGQGWSFADEA